MIMMLLMTGRAAPVYHHDDTIYDDHHQEEEDVKYDYDDVNDWQSCLCDDTKCYEKHDDTNHGNQEENFKMGANQHPTPHLGKELVVC